MGLFPDNFVEVINAKNEPQEQEQWHETSSIGTKSRHSHQVKKSEKAHVRKSLDSRNVHPSNISGKMSNCVVCKRYFLHRVSVTCVAILRVRVRQITSRS